MTIEVLWTVGSFISITVLALFVLWQALALIATLCDWLVQRGKRRT